MLEVSAEEEGQLSLSLILLGGFVIIGSAIEIIFNSHFFNFLSLHAILDDYSCLPDSSRKFNTSKS